MTTNVLQQVADYLTAHKLTVSIEYPGFLSVWAEDLVSHPDHVWAFGTANDTWMGDLQDGNGEYLGQTLDTGILSTETEPIRIAAAIIRVLENQTNV